MFDYERTAMFHDKARPHTTKATNHSIRESNPNRLHEPIYSQYMNLCIHNIFRNIEVTKVLIDFLHLMITRPNPCLL